MTPTMQRGFDDQAAGALDPVLATADTAEGREYREGARQARRDAFDEALGQEPHRPAPFTAEIFSQEPPPVAEIAPPGPETAESGVGGSKNLGGAFAEPEPSAKRARKAKPADRAQGDLFT